jgi:hypothetical protein
MTTPNPGGHVTDEQTKTDEQGIERGNPSGEQGYTEPRPEQKRGEGQDLGQKQADTLNDADWNQKDADAEQDAEQERRQRARSKTG